VWIVKTTFIVELFWMLAKNAVYIPHKFSIRNLSQSSYNNCIILVHLWFYWVQECQKLHSFVTNIIPICQIFVWRSQYKSATSVNRAENAIIKWYGMWSFFHISKPKFVSHVSLPTHRPSSILNTNRIIIEEKSVSCSGFFYIYRAFSYKYNKFDLVFI